MATGCRVDTTTQHATGQTFGRCLPGNTLPGWHLEAFFLQRQVRGQALLATLGRFRQALGHGADSGAAKNTLPTHRGFATDDAVHGALDPGSASHSTQDCAHANAVQVRAGIRLRFLGGLLCCLGRCALLHMLLLHSIVDRAFDGTCALGSAKSQTQRSACSRPTPNWREHGGHHRHD